MVSISPYRNLSRYELGSVRDFSWSSTLGRRSSIPLFGSQDFPLDSPWSRVSLGYHKSVKISKNTGPHK